jgi:hypothetical protein
MKKSLVKVTEKARKDQEGADEKPSLLGIEKGCSAPPKSEFESGQTIETLCSQVASKPAGR